VSCESHGLGAPCCGVHDEHNAPDDEPERCAACDDYIDADGFCFCDDNLKPTVKTARVAS
jgi:hypothetical protein